MTAVETSPSVPDRRRHVVRLGGEHLLNTARLSTRAVNSDLLTTTLFLAISRANVREVTAAAQKGPHYSGIDEIPPDELRRPISVYALARELRLPYETARRYAGKLLRARIVERVGDGLVIPSVVYARAGMRQILEETCEETQRFVDALAQAGVHGPTPTPSPGDRRRQVLRLAVEFYLRSIDRLTNDLDLELVHALVYVAIVQSNIRHLIEDGSMGREFAALGAAPPDRMRRTVSVYAIARDLRLPYETTRRYVGQLIDRGLCARGPQGGLLVPQEVHQRPRLMEGVDGNWSDTMDYLRDLAAIGLGPSPA